LHVSAGGVQALQPEQSARHPRVPTVPQLAVQLEVEPDTHAKVSSVSPSQSSSAALQSSAGGVQAPHVHEAEQSRLPVVPQPVVHVPVEPCRHSNPLSATMSQSSSAPLHTSAGGVQVPDQAQEAVHASVPMVAHAVVHERDEPARQVKPSSLSPSQSLSAPSQVSIGGVQEPHTHPG